MPQNYCNCSNICGVLIPQEPDCRETVNWVQLYPEKIIAEYKRGVRNYSVAPLIKEAGSNFFIMFAPQCEHKVKHNLL